MIMYSFVFCSSRLVNVDINEMGINFGYQPLDKLMIGIQFFARDLGGVGNDEIQGDYANASYRFKDYFGVRADRMKNTMGLYSEFRDVDMLRTSEKKSSIDFKLIVKSQ